MDYNVNDIEKILNFTSWTPRKKIDTLLHMDCIMYAQLGIDSTKKEKEEVIMIELIKDKWADTPVKWKVAAGIVVAVIIIAIIK